MRTHRHHISAALLFLLTILLTFTTVLAQPDVPKDRFFVFVGMGHSNMAGRSKEYDTETHPRCWMYKDGSWKLAKEVIQGWGGGPAMPFLKKLAALYPDYHFGWIGTAASSLMIRDYHRGHSRYSTALNLAREAQSVGTVAGVLTMLGMQEGRESKSTEAIARSVCEDFETLITQFRDDIGIDNLPLLVGRYEEHSERYLSGGSDARWADIVIDEIRQVPSQVTRAKVIESDGPFDDDHHFNYTGHKRWSELAANLIKNNGYLTLPGPTDDTPPSAPGNLQATSVTYNSVSLSWSASTDDVGVTGYDVYRGSTEIAAVTGTSHTASGLSPSTGYSFTVRARDDAGNVSSPSAALDITTEALVDNTPPSPPTGLALVSATVSSLEVSWAASSDNIEVAGYDVYVDGVKRASVSGTGTTLHGLDPSTAYTITVQAKDIAGNLSPFSAPLPLSTTDPHYASLPLKVNLGGPAAQGYVADKAWVAGSDHGFTGEPAATWYGRTHSDEWVPTAGTDLDTVYQYVRHDGGAWGYRVSVPPGYYRVTMQFAEYWRNAVGGRVFNLYINENQLPESPVDVFEQVGGATAYTVIWTGVLTDGQLALDFESVTSNAMMNGLVVEPVPPYQITYPSGGEQFTVGQQITIAWQTIPMLDNAIVELTPDQGETWHTLHENSIAPDDPRWEAFPLTIPSTLNGQSLVSSFCLVRIRDYDNLNIVQLAAPFAITGGDAVALDAHLTAVHHPLQLTLQRQVLHVRWPGHAGTAVTVLDARGRLVGTSTLTGTGGSVPLKGAHGVLCVRLDGAAGRVVRRVMRY